jgi:heme A synthase
VIDIILTLHKSNVYLVFLSSLVAGIWGLILYFKKLSASKAWHISLFVALGLGLLQGVLGISMVAVGLKPGGGVGDYYLHYVYGGIVALGLPLVWISFTTNGKDKRLDMLAYSLGALFIAIVAVRAWMTGPVHPLG